MYADPRLMHDVGYEMLSASALWSRNLPQLVSSPDYDNTVPEIGVRSLYKTWTFCRLTGWLVNFVVQKMVAVLFLEIPVLQDHV
jgi:hypothetical protein